MTAAQDQIAHVAITLFNGWGYNFYRKENQLRADDLMVRAKVSGLLADARSYVESAEQQFRREFLPPPSREKPRHDPDAIKGAQTLESIAHALGALEGHIRALPVPENDRMTQRFRRESESLARLLEADQEMVGHVEFMRSLLTSASPAWILENALSLRQQIAAVERAVQSRGDLLAF